MTQFAASLRGVNLKIAEIATGLTKAGFANVCTILVSSNVLLQSSFGVATSRRKTGAALHEQFGYQT
ncbi:DUF1697 domain-containing protein [Mycobacterium uberis]|uniref:DUF1697 domain-containing protein n=1 Tax=Mycobacterium uberis TaxID=2162698 RepID=UPI001FB26FA3|nr:DUF1697 domain-containing protein [Mycobacterium uberis]